MSESEQTWYYLADGQPCGPLTPDQLHAMASIGQIDQTTLVWTEALDDEWVAGGNVEGLFSTEQPLLSQPRPVTGPVSAPSSSIEPRPTATATGRQVLPTHAEPPAINESSRGVPPPLPPDCASLASAPKKASFTSLASLSCLCVLCLLAAFYLWGDVEESARAFGDKLGESLGSIFINLFMFLITIGMWQNFEEVEGVGEEFTTLMESLMFFSGAVLVGVFFAALYRTLSFVYLHRAWGVLRRNQPRTSANKAIGFLFIPFYNLYWVFVAYPGFVKEWARLKASHPGLLAAPPVSASIALIPAICWVVLSSLVVLALGVAPGGELSDFIRHAAFAVLIATIVTETVFYANLCHLINFLASPLSDPTEIARS